jgi:predicted ATPase
MSKVEMKPRSAFIRPGEDGDLDRAINWIRAHWQAVVRDRSTPLQITLRTPRIPCSASMRNTLHMWFGEIANASGNELEDVKEALCREFIGTREVTVGSRTFERRRSTEGLSKADYLALMDRVQAWAAEWDIEITQPDPAMRAGWIREIERERQREERAA